MELALKLPKDKLPFIGIRFYNEHEAASVNKSAVNNYHTSQYQIILEPQADKLNLRLVCSTFGLNHIYENLRYKPDQIMRFLYHTKGTKEFNFGHVVEKDGKDVVVKTVANQRLFVLKVSKLEVREDAESGL